jgi:hypothetical protein
MPQLDQYEKLLEAVVFLYENKADAEAGVDSGGTGFLVALPMKRWANRVHVHAVTNWHVAVSGVDSPPTPCVRINTIAGKPEVFEFDAGEWIFKPSGPDVAISPPLATSENHKISFLGKEWFLTSEKERQAKVGLGDDTFMVGRFVDYDGVEQNEPAVRFGHISITSANIHQQTGYAGRSIVLDMHSRSGFSGSPVFVYRTLGSKFFDPQPGKFLQGGGHFLELLGIHWGQFPEIWEIGKDKKIKSQIGLITDGSYVEGLSVMTCVIPAQAIIDLLNDPQLERMREENELKPFQTA